ncbi:MAG TPA: hypothetical protein VL221_05775 [Bacteroidota bacterium]|nr:hypothetical protein [Bacteroidota bacterium]
MKKLLLILAGVLAIGVLGFSIWLYQHRERIVTVNIERGLAKVEEQVIQKLPDAAAMAGGRADFQKLRDMLEAGLVRTEDVQSLEETFQMSYKAGTMDSVKAKEIAGEVHRLASAPANDGH